MSDFALHLHYMIIQFKSYPLNVYKPNKIQIYIRETYTHLKKFSNPYITFTWLQKKNMDDMTFRLIIFVNPINAHCQRNSIIIIAHKITLKLMLNPLKHKRTYIWVKICQNSAVHDKFWTWLLITYTHTFIRKNLNNSHTPCQL